MTNNTESNNNTIKITDANITDPIIAKINGTDKRQLEPEYGRLRKLYDKGTFIKPQNFDLKNLKFQLKKNKKWYKTEIPI